MTGDPAWLARALDTLDDVFYVYHATDGLVYWNRRLEVLFDLTEADLSGMTPTEFFVPEDRPGVAAAVADIYETGETVVEAVAGTTEGRIRFELTGRLLTDGDGTPIGFAGTGRDVTDDRDETWQLARENERLAEFADVLAHDLRNPLSVASGHLALVRARVDDHEATEHFDRLAAAHSRIETIIADIRSAAREGVLATQTEPVDLAAVTADAWDTIRAPDATLDCRATGTVEADRDRLQRLLENLFRNSVEHGSTSSRPRADDSVEHGSTNDRTVRIVVTDTETGFAVEDDGPGIPLAERAAVFEPGISLADGTGFGLAIVRSITRAHDWDVTVAEGTMGGARFVFDCRGESGESAGPAHAEGGHEAGDESVDDESEAANDECDASRDKGRL